MAFLITCGQDGVLYDWQAGICITPTGSEAIPTQARGTCPTCRRRDVDLRNGVCIRCFLEGPDCDDE